MGIIENLVNSIIKNLTTTVRKFTAFVFIVFTLGVFLGTKVALKYGITGSGGTEILLAFIVPLSLAFLSYYVTEIAVIFFLLFMVVLILI